jgi:hypothetical protein
MSKGGVNFAQLYNRPQDWIAPYESAPESGAGNIDYSDYGYIPNVAQNTQQTAVPPPSLNPQPAFTTNDLFAANWFTTRVHLSPLGKVQQ